MFKIESTEQRDTFRLRSTQRPEIVFEVSAITKDAYESIGDFREHIESVLSEAPRLAVQNLKNAVVEYTAADKLADLLRITAETRALQKAYFKNRFTADLEKSKLLERKLDALVLELGRGEKSEQGKLF